MTATSKHHHELTDGKGKCSVPMYMGGLPAGFCDEQAFGKQPHSPQVYHAGKGHNVRADGKYDGYVPGLACRGHGGPKCPGIEIEPGEFSGCDASETGAKDCPTCGGG